jgi:cytochrome c553
MKTSTILFSLLAATALPAAAQNNAAGDELGRQIADKGAGGAVAACASCHGAKGEGNPAGNFPRIAGQSQIYLAHQLTSFADGSRKSANPVMEQIAKGLNRQQIEAVSAYYAGLEAPATKTAAPASAPKSDASRGETLAMRGDARINVQACANCHGPGGNGEPPAYPYLAGQQAAYLQTTLQEWKNGQRNTDPSGQMQLIAKRLSDSDIAAAAAYYAARPAPAPVGTRVVMQAGRTPAQTSSGGGGGTSGSQAAQGGSTPVQGIGSEQGAATGGGGQGPGGGGGASGSGPSGSETGTGQRAR